MPRGAIVSMSQYAMHRQARWWPEPERFEPARWVAGRPAGLPRGAFFPFGDGPRRCIAEHFARAEAAMVVATLARRWRLTRVEQAPVRLDPKVTLRPRGGLRMQVRSRAERPDG